MKKLGTQAKSQFSYMKAHKGKMVGTGLGIATGVVYGMSGKQSNMVIAGLAVVGAAAGAILGGMFDKPNAVVVGTNGDAAVANSGDEQAMSNAIGRIGAINRIGAANRVYNCRYYDPEVGYYYQNQTTPCKGYGRYKKFFR